MDETKLNEKIEILECNYSKLHTLESAQLFEEITKAISEHVEFENKENDSTDGVITVLSEITDSV